MPFPKVLYPSSPNDFTCIFTMGVLPEQSQVHDAIIEVFPNNVCIDIVIVHHLTVGMYSILSQGVHLWFLCIETYWY